MLLTTAMVYEKALFTPDWLCSGDNFPVYSPDVQLSRLAAFTGDWQPDVLGRGVGARPFSPLALVGIVLPPHAANVWSFAVCSILLYFAGYHLLRSRGYSRAASAVPALWLTFAGYGFTLISAGHRGVFQMLPAAVFMLGFIARAVAGPSLAHFAAVSLCAAWGMAVQPDIMGMFLVLGAVYGFVLSVEHWPKEKPTRFVSRLFVGGAIASVVAALHAIPIWQFARQTILPAREASMGVTPEQRWEFASNWSMPPEEMAEFIAPCIFGAETDDRERPYWGRLGRTLDWETTRTGFRNFRQHTVYLGAIPLMLATYGVASVLRRPRRTALPSCDAAGPNARADVAFWATTGTIALLLALGRYFVLFRWFHALPFFSSVRCPVKFMHIVDVSLAVLFACGLEQLFRASHTQGTKIDAAPGRKVLSAQMPRTNWPTDKLFVRLSLTLTAIGWIIYTLLPFFRSALDAYWHELGFAGVEPVLFASMQQAVLHAAACMTVVTLAFGYKCCAHDRDALRLTPVIAAGIAVALIVDIVAVCHPFVRVRDLDIYYRDNGLARPIVASGSHLRLSYQAAPLRRGDPLWLSFVTHGVQVLEPAESVALDSELQSFFNAFRGNPLRLWQLTSTGYVFGQTASLRNLLHRPEFSVVSYARLGDRGFDASDRESDFVLLRYHAALPRIALYYHWDDVPEPQQQLQRLVGSDWDPTKTILASTDAPAMLSDREPSAITPSVYRSNRIEADVTAASAGILVVNDRYAPGWKARVDGRPAHVLRCNYVMRGVEIPAGHHHVVLSYEPNAAGFLTTLLLPLAVGVWYAVERAVDTGRLRLSVMVDTL